MVHRLPHGMLRCAPTCSRRSPPCASCRQRLIPVVVCAADDPVLELPTMRDVLQPQDSPFKISNNSGGGFGTFLTVTCPLVFMNSCCALTCSGLP